MHVILTCTMSLLCGDNTECILDSSLVPRRSGGGAKEKNAWYTLFAHVLN